MNEMAGKYPNFTFIGVTDRDEIDLDAVTNLGITYSVANGTEKTRKMKGAFGIGGIPHALIIRDGIVRADLAFDYAPNVSLLSLLICVVSTDLTPKTAQVWFSGHPMDQEFDDTLAEIQADLDDEEEKEEQAGTRTLSFVRHGLLIERIPDSTVLVGKSQHLLIAG